MDNIFKVQELDQPSFFQKLFKKLPKANSVTEINNLLATKPIREIQLEEVDSIASKYKVNLKNKEFSSQLKELYQRYLKKCLEDRIFQEGEVQELNVLKQLFLLTDKDVAELHNQIASEIYKMTFDEAIQDGSLDNNERQLLEKVQINLKLPDDLVKKISEESRTQLMNLKMKQATEDKRISPTEWKELETIAKNLNITLPSDSATKADLDRMKLYWAIENGELPVQSIWINLQAGERCYYNTQVEWYENRTVTQRVNYSGPSYRVKIMKGVYYRWGSSNVQRITQDVLKLIDTGTVYITNKRIIFTGQRKNSNIPLKKVLSITPYSDGVGIDKDTGKSPVLSVAANADILAMMISRMMNDLND